MRDSPPFISRAEARRQRRWLPPPTKGKQEADAAILHLQGGRNLSSHLTPPFLLDASSSTQPSASREGKRGGLSRDKKSTRSTSMVWMEEGAFAIAMQRGQCTYCLAPQWGALQREDWPQ